MKIASLVFLLLMISGYNSFCRQLRPVYDWSRMERAIKEKNPKSEVAAYSNSRKILVLKQDSESVK